jgi:formamidopyrimidine-DNA glycosylase
MPELPEVERGRRIAEGVARDRRISTVQCDDDDIVFDGVAPAHVRRALKGAAVRAVRRRGKHLWFELDRAPHPLFHFGMTGAFLTPGIAALRLASSPKRVRDDGWPPRFTKIHIRFDDGGELVMTNKRRLGRIRLREDPEREPPISELGFDPLLDLPTPRRFFDLLTGRSAVLKSVLLDQGFAAGVGNWIADEVLYQAGIDPRRRTDSLARDEAERLRRKLGAVVRHAVRVDADKDRFPKSWLFHHRWGKDGAARTAKREKIRFLTVGGRTTAWVPAAQR